MSFESSSRRRLPCLALSSPGRYNRVARNRSTQPKWQPQHQPLSHTPSLVNIFNGRKTHLQNPLLRLLLRPPHSLPPTRRNLRPILLPHLRIPKIALLNPLIQISMHRRKQIIQRHASSILRIHVDVPRDPGVREPHEWQGRFGRELREVVGRDGPFEVFELDLGEVEAEVVG